MRGYFEIGVYHAKTAHNVGTLWRSAYQMGAAGIFTIGHRFPKQAADTVKAYRHIPWRQHLDFESFFAQMPHACPLIGIEMGGKSLPTTTHPESAIYLLGAEDHGLPPEILKRCNRVIALPAVRTESYNVAVAGSLVMYDRNVKQGVFA